MTSVVHYAVIGHWKRQGQAESLAEQVGARLFLDTEDMGALANHKRAIGWAAGMDGHLAVLEDDALPCGGLKGEVQRYIANYPNRLISLYLGTGRPPQWEDRKRREIAHAEEIGSDHLELTQLCHGLGYIVPTDTAQHILDHMRPRDKAADFAIGNAWRKHSGGKPVIYTWPSLVDHQDGPSIEAHPDGEDRTETRRAWSFKDGGTFQTQGHP